MARHQVNEARSVLLVRGGEMTPNQDPGISCMRPARQIIDLGRASRSELSAANNATKKRLLFLEVSFEYIIHNAQEKLFVARHQANEARSVLLVREHLTNAGKNATGEKHICLRRRKIGSRHGAWALPLRSVLSVREQAKSPQQQSRGPI